MATNDHPKAFELGPARSPEEVARENVRKSMPSVRRSVNQLRLSPAAKWFFCVVSDDSFMSDFGGDGFGTLITTFKELAARYKHDRGSVGRWAEELLDRPEVLWCEHEWPYVKFHISAFVPCPTLKASAAQKLRARASAARMVGCAASTYTPLFVPPKGESARNAEETDKVSGDVPARCAASTYTTCGDVPARCAASSSKLSGYLPHTVGVDAPHCAGTSPHTVSLDAAHQAATVPTSPESEAMESGEKSPPKKSPRTRLENIKGGEAGAPPDKEEEAFKTWESRLERQFPRELEKLYGLLKGQLAAAKTDSGRELIKRKIDAVNLRLLGPVAVEQSTINPAPVKIAKPKPQVMDLEQVKKLWADSKKASAAKPTP